MVSSNVNGIIIDMTCYCDYEPAEFYHRETPIASKKHACYDCGCTIKPGEKYERVNAKWDGVIVTAKTCPDCVAIRSALMDMDCFCWSHGGLLEDVTTQFQEADFQPGMRYAYLRIVADHRWHKKRGA
jgi:hypothetical protein